MTNNTTKANILGKASAFAVERRQGTRLVTILRVGKLISAESQELCLIRNISDGGLMAHVYSPHMEGDRVVIEFKSDHHVSGTIKWVQGENVGVIFDEEIDVAHVLRTASTANGRRARAPRLEVRGHAWLKVGDKTWQVEVRDLSQGGAKVEIAARLPIGEYAVITVNGLRPVKAVVRWQEFGCAGLEFIPAIPFGELTEWLGMHDDPPEDTAA